MYVKQSKIITTFTFVKYILFYIFTGTIVSFVGGIIIRQHGQLCGIDLYSPKQWPTNIILMNSDLCRSLSYFERIFNQVLQNIFFHILYILSCVILSIKIKTTRTQ